MKKRRLLTAIAAAALLCAACAEKEEENDFVQRMYEDDRPCLVETVYPTAAPVVADIIATDEAYGADASGETDSTDAIRRALRACADNGGGTVYLPAGTYRVSGTIDVPAFTTLHGDWLDPDTVKDPSEIESYGTLILACQESSEDTADCLFNIFGSAGVIGLTVYYPEQDIHNVKPYPFTFYTSGLGEGGYMLASVQNCTVLNGYAGIGACVSETNAHEMLTVENVKGTFLAVGAEAYNQADVGTWKSVTISPSYWANASAGLLAADYDQVAAYMRAHTIGLKLGDLEWTQFADIRIESCQTGIATVVGKRISFAGALMDTTVTDCDIALDVQDMDDRWGMVIARSSLSGSVAAVRNASGGVVKMTDVSLSGELLGDGAILLDDSALSAYLPNYDQTYESPRAALYIAPIPADTDEDVSALLQQALDEVGTRGGILYLPAGKYRIESPVVVPTGVELRGASSVPTRDQSGCSKGTLILTAYGVGAENPEEMQALVTLQQNAGISGLRFFYTTNSPTVASATPYTVRGAGSGVYAVNCSIVAAGSGIDFRGCDGHFIKKFVGVCYDSTLCVGGVGGHVEGCLQNGNALTRSGLDLPDGWVDESQIFIRVFPILQSRSTFLTLEDAEGEVVLQCFAYGVSRLIALDNAQGIVISNVGGDNINSTHAMVLAQEGSRGVIVNMMRYNGSSYSVKDESTLDLYNRLTIGKTYEKNRIDGENREHTSLNG